MTTDLIQRLKDWRGDPDEVMQEAAEALEQLQIENQRLRGIVPETLEKLNDELIAENEGLRKDKDRLLDKLFYQYEIS